MPELGEELRSTTTTPTAVDDSEDESYIPEYIRESGRQIAQNQQDFEDYLITRSYQHEIDVSEDFQPEGYVYSEAFEEEFIDPTMLRIYDALWPEDHIYSRLVNPTQFPLPSSRSPSPPHDPGYEYNDVDDYD